MIGPDSTWNKDESLAGSPWNVGRLQAKVFTFRHRGLARHGDLDAITFSERLFLDIHQEEESPLRQFSSISTKVCSML